MSIQLTTLAKVKEYAGITGTQNDIRLKTIIAAVSDEIQTYCGRTFALTTYRTWLDGSGTPHMLLPNFPVSALIGACYESDDALTVKNTTAKFATVGIADGKLNLWSVDTAGAEAQTDLVLASYPTIAALVEQIVATGGGWTASTISGMETSPSILLRPTSGSLALSPSYATLRLPADFDDFVELVPETDRMIRSFAGFPKGKANVFVYYKAGYTLPNEQDEPGNLPDALMIIVARVVMDVYNVASSNAAYKQESIGDHSWTLADGLATRAVLAHGAELSPYRALTI